MLIKTNTVVLRTLKYGESQVIVDMFTKSHGRLSFLQTLSKTNRTKIKKQLFQPLTLLDITFDYRAKSKLQRIKEACLSYPLSTIHFDQFKLSIALFVAEFTYYCTKAEQRNEPMFNYIVGSIRWLDTSQVCFTNFHIVYMLRLSKFIGFFPNLQFSSSGYFFDLRNGCFTSSQPMHSDFLAPEEANKICLLMRMGYQTMHLFTLSRNERNRCVEIAIKYYRLHIPDFPELKSLSVLRELFV